MSTLENTVIFERLSGAFELAMADDSALEGKLAEKTLEGHEYYFYCKEGGDLDYEYIYDKIEETFINEGMNCFDIRHLSEITFKFKM